jgi:hypothetical protein
MLFAIRGRSRTRRVLKWAGTGVCLLIVAFWLASIRAPRAMRLGLTGIVVRSGQIAIERWNLTDERGSERLAAHLTAQLQDLLEEYYEWELLRHPRPWDSLGSYGLVLPSMLRADVVSPPSGRVRLVHVMIGLPFWLLLSVVAVPTMIAWRLDRRRNPAGRCQECGYDLTGNVSGRCPECGEPIRGACEVKGRPEPERCAPTHADECPGTE